MEAMRPTLVIIDDHEAFRATVSALLEAEGFSVVGTAADGDSGLSVVAELRPDLVLVDIQLPGVDGFEVARRIGQLAQAPPVVLISSRGRSAYQARIERAAVLAFLTKQ
jgi:CheY-like chemotaxis protein